jgi:hypothetical protein
MEHRALDTPSSPAASTQDPESERDGRNIWILTAYGISGVALFAVLAYYFSAFLTGR